MSKKKLKNAYVPQEPARKSARLVAMKKKKAAASKASAQQLKNTPKSTGIGKETLGRCSSSRQFPNPLPGRKRPRKSRTIKELVGQNSALQDPSRNAVRQARLPSQEPLPHNEAVELFLRTLEKMDIYHIYSEPVDPVKVPGYYKFIKQPLDFTTIREKLHKGLYKSLQELERDVFLISNNAMMFNPSRSIFYKDAYEFQEMTKEAFIFLRDDLKEIKAEKAQISAKQKHRHDVVTQTAGAMSLGGPIVGASSARRVGSSRTDQGGIAHTRRSINGSDFRNFERRNTYKPWTPLNVNSIAVNIVSKELVPARDIASSYKDSLMRFIQDLGPTAKMFAQRKLRGLSDVPGSQQELASHVTTLKNRPSDDTPMLMQTPPSIDNTNKNTNAGTGDIAKGLGGSSANTELLGITARHYQARTHLKDITVPIEKPVATPHESTNQPNYNVHVTTLVPSMPAQKGYGLTGSRASKQNISSSNKLDNGKNVVSNVDIDYGEKTAQLCGEQFPGLNAMMQRATQSTSNGNGVPSMQTMLSLGSSGSFLGQKL